MTSMPPPLRVCCISCCYFAARFPSRARVGQIGYYGDIKADRRTLAQIAGKARSAGRRSLAKEQPVTGRGAARLHRREVSERVGGGPRLRNPMPVTRWALARRSTLRGVQLKDIRAALSLPDADRERTA